MNGGPASPCGVFDVAEVAGERGHVVGSVGEPEDVVPDQLASGCVSELPVDQSVPAMFGELLKHVTVLM